MSKTKIINLKAVTMIFCLFSGAGAILASATLAWITYTNTNVDPGFDGSVVKSYFDEGSYSTTTDGVTTYTNIITRPVHLYNLAYLTDTGNLTESSTVKYVFQLGKQVNGTGTCYVYNSANALSSTTLDMTDSSAYQQIPPVGTSDHPFASIFAGNHITISNLIVKDTVFTTDTTSLTDVGLFGYIGDGVSLKNFNLDAPVINLSGTNQVAGIVIGYVNQSATGSIAVNGIGVKDGGMEGHATFMSEYSLVGGGTDRGLATITNNNENYSSGNDYGVMYADEMYAKLQSADATITNNFEWYNSSYWSTKANAWIGSSGASSFGIFNLTANTSAPGNSAVAFRPYGSTQSIDFYDFSAEFEAEYANPTLDVTKKLTAPVIDGTTIAANDSTRKSNVSLGDGSDKAKLFLDTNGDQITSSTYSLAFPNKAKYTSTMSAVDYSNSNQTATKYQNSLFFHIANPTGGLINFIAFVPSNKTKSTRSVGIWKLDEESSPTGNETQTADGIIHGDTPNLFEYVITRGLASTIPSVYCGFSFRLSAGSYMISSSQNGLYFCYVAVGGQSSGTSGTPVGNGISLDYIKVASEDVSATAYVFSKVTFKIEFTTAADFTFYFDRTLDQNDSDSSSNVTLYYTPSSASTSIATIGTSTAATLTNGSPP